MTRRRGAWLLPRRRSLLRPATPGPFVVGICQQVDCLAIRAVACGIAFDMPGPVG